MRSTEIYIGDCPYCGDELFIFKTKSRSRLAKCINTECPAEYVFGIPKKGTIEVTALYCPKPIPTYKGNKPLIGSQIQLLAIIPNEYIKSGTFRTQKKKTYFWATKPCFTCSRRSTCSPLLEGKEEFLDETELLPISF